MAPATKMAPIKIVTDDEELGRIEPEHLMHVLVVEDELEVRQRISRRLGESGYSVHAYSSPREAAENLKPNQYQLVIMDIRFDAPNISGDEFVHKNADAFTASKVVAFTGHEDDIVHNDVFDHVFLKGQPAKNPLYEYAQTVYRDRQREVATDIQKRLMSTGENGNEGLTALATEAKEELLRILNQTNDKDAKLVWYKGREFSSNDLVQEIEDDTSTVGKSHIRMVMDRLMRRRAE